LVANLAEQASKWTRHSHGRHFFDVVLLGAGKALGPIADQIMDIFYLSFDQGKDPELRLSFFALLAKLLSRPGESLNSLGNFAAGNNIIRQIVIPNCVWQNGRVAAALRTAAVTCLWTLLQSDLCTEEDVQQTHDELLPQLIACMDDDYEETRHVCCCIVEVLLSRYPRVFARSDSTGFDRLHKIYPELIKRLDDSSDGVRTAALAAWVSYGKCLRLIPYDIVLYRAHIEMVLKGLFIHLDDADDKIQDKVQAVLLEIGSVDPNLVCQFARDARDSHRTANRCDDIIEKLAN